MSGRSTGRRVTMQEAADELDVTVEAIRKRVQRGTIRSDKGDDGRRYVYLDEYQTEVPLEGSEPSPLVEELREQVHYLREQLRREQDAHGEARRIIAALTSRIPQLEAPREPQESEQESEQGEAGVEDREEPEKRPWWRRWFGE